MKTAQRNPLKIFSVLWIGFIMGVFYKTFPLLSMNNPYKNVMTLGFLILYPIIAAWRIRYWLFGE